MEPADIDWKKVDSRFVWDDLYEHFNAPKWVDFSATHGDNNNDNGDEAWFCRPDCRHPKSAEDYLQMSFTPPTPKVRVLGSLSTNSNNNNQQRDGNLKRRAVLLPPHSSSSSLASSPIRHSPRTKLTASKKKFREDIENQNPNVTSPAQTHPLKTGVLKAAAKENIKSSTEKPKREEVDGLDSMPQHQRRRLKSTLSARNLFAGKDILSQISEFCSEIKKLAVIGRERKSQCHGEEGDERKVIASAEKKIEPLKEKCRKKLSKDMNSGQCRRPDGGDRLALLQQEVRSSPPTPQQIPSPLGWYNQTKVSPLKPLAPERGILQELVQNKDEENEQMPQTDNGCSFVAPAGTEAKTLDMFWFFKPCTYLGR